MARRGVDTWPEEQGWLVSPCHGEAGTLPAPWGQQAPSWVQTGFNMGLSILIQFGWVKTC